MARYFCERNALCGDGLGFDSAIICPIDPIKGVTSLTAEWCVLRTRKIKSRTMQTWKTQSLFCLVVYIPSEEQKGSYFMNYLSEEAQVSFSTYIYFIVLSHAFVDDILLSALLCCIQNANEGIYG